MSCRLTIKDIKERLNSLNSLGTPLFRFVENIEQTRFPLDEYRNTDVCPVEETSSFEAYLEKNFSRDKDASRIPMNNANLLFFLMGGNRRLVSDNTTMSRLVNAKPAGKFYDLVISDLVDWKLSAGEDGRRKFVDCREAGVPENAVTMIDYIVQENDLIISRFCSRESQKALRELLREYALNICAVEIPEPDSTNSVKPAHVDLTIMERGPVEKLSEFLGLTATMTEVSEGKGKQTKYLAQGLTWLLIASLLRGKLSAVYGELDKAFRDAHAESDAVGLVETEDLSGKGRKTFVDSDTGLYMKLMNRFHYIRDQHPSIKMMKPDPDLFPRGLSAIRSSERKASEGDKEPVSIKDMVEKSWEEHKHLLLVGEGGIGKTIAMLTLPDEDWVRELQIPSLYIPLQSLDIYEGNLTSYIKDSYHSDMGKISALAETPWEKYPQVLLLLDGFNEIPMEYRKAAEKHIRAWMDKPGVQVITTSRISLFLKDRFLEYRLEPLPETAVRTFLLSSGLSEGDLPGIGDPLWKVINVPLMLAMFVQTDRVKAVAESSDILLDWKKSDSAAHIIWNYLQMELYRFVSIAGSDTTLCAAAILAIAPYVCYEMATGGKFYAEQGDFKDIIRKAVRFFSQNPFMIPEQVRDICDYFDGFNIEEALDDGYYRSCFDLLSGQSVLFQKEVNQRRETPDSGRKLKVIYVPAHQNFRDALAAVFISTCMLNSAREKQPFPEEILSTADFYVKNYISEFLAESELLKIWEYHRNSEPANGRMTWILMDIFGRQRDYDYRELNFSGLDLTEIDLHRLLSKRLDICPLPKDKDKFSGTKIAINTLSKQSNLSGYITCLDYSNDGRSVACGYNNGVIQIVKMESGETQTLRVLSNAINTIAYDPRGNSLAIGTADGTVLLLDINSEEYQVLGCHKKGISCVTYDPKRNRLASISWDGLVLLWDLDNRQTVEIEKSNGCSISFDPKGNYLAYGLIDGSIRAFNLITGDYKNIGSQLGYIKKISFSNDGKHLAVVSINDFNSTIKSMDLKNGKVCTLEIDSIVTAMVRDPISDYIAIGSSDGILQLWDTYTNNSAVLGQFQEGAIYIAYNPRGSHIAYCLSDGSVRTWEFNRQKHAIILKGVEQGVTSVAYDPRNNCLACGSMDGTIRIWDLSSKEYTVLKGHLGAISSLVYNPSSNSLASGSGDKTIRLWNLSDGTNSVLKGHLGSVYSLAYNSEGDCLISGAEDGKIILWDLYNKRHKILEDLQMRVYSIAYDSSRNCLASGALNGEIRLYNFEKNSSQVLDYANGGVTAIAFGFNGKVLMCGTEHGTIEVWDTDSGESSIKKHSLLGYVHCIAYDPSKKRFATSDDCVYIWDLMEHYGFPLNDFDKTVISLAFDPRKNRLAAGMQDGTLHIWDFEEVAEISCFRIIPHINLSGANFEAAIMSEADKYFYEQAGAKVKWLK